LAGSATHASSGVGFGIFGHLAGYTVCCKEDDISKHEIPIEKFGPHSQSPGRVAY